MLQILYDATVLVNGVEDEGERRGIYFTAQNILDQFLKRNDVHITLFADVCKITGLKKLSNYADVDKFAKSIWLEDLLYEKAIFFRRKRLDFFSKPLIRKFFAFIVLLFETSQNLIRFPLILKLLKDENFTYFSPLTSAPFFIQKNTRVKKFVILYDAIPFRLDAYKAQRKGEWFGHLVKSLNSTDCYLAISEKTKFDFCELFPKIKSDNVFVTPLAASESFKTLKGVERKKRLLGKYNLPPQKYVFSLCTLEPRKNVIRTVRSFIKFIEKTHASDIVFVLGGGSWNSFIDKIKKDVDGFDKYKDFVIWAGYIEDEDLPVFYSNAEWFVYTSQYEGFGLPPLEAMQCGCPVITSNNSSLPEVVGNAGIMIDWDSDEQHVAAYEKYYFNEELRKENSQKGLERAKQFSWKKTTEKMVRIMESNK